MTALNVTEIISLDSHARTVRFGKNEEIVKRPHIEHQPDPDQFKAAAGIINKLFSELQTCFPAWRQTFTSKADMDAVKRTWARGLIEAKITSYKQLQWGLLKARRSESPFWPSLGQFIAWCHPDPADYGLPTPVMAFREASRKSHPAADRSNWSHPAVYVAAREVGSFELTNLPSSQSQPLFERAYKIAIRRVMAGEDLNVEIPKALPPRPAPRPVESEVAKQNIERLKRMLKGGK
ncbi:replication protein P [Shewanella algae]|uniref:replication protein P n=1 Tax=Shewanella algae TaxID=38313 RepID=UPI001AAD7397|nr:replication protein P [Shewanella algae]MBO2610990.1 replication protein P [Shewanella algae]